MKLFCPAGRKALFKIPSQCLLPADRQVTTESEKPVAKSDDHVKKFELPRRHLDQDEFVRCVQECRIVKDVATIHRLFDALTDGERGGRRRERERESQRAGPWLNGQ